MYFSFTNLNLPGWAPFPFHSRLAGFKWRHGVMSQESSIFAVPASASNVLVIDTVTLNVTQLVSWSEVGVVEVLGKMSKLKSG